MTTYTTSMFDKIKSALSDTNQTSNSKYKDILKTKVGNVYTVRFVPNMAAPDKTFWRYFTYSWESFSTGQFMSHVSPETWAKKCPIGEARRTLTRNGTPEEKEKISKVMWRENWLANVYVVDDPTEPDNNGKVKLLRYSKQLNKPVMAATVGEDSDEFGEKVFDLTENGCNFKIKVERQGDYPTYVSSRFAGPSKIDGMTEEKIQEVYDTFTDLETAFPVKTYDELKEVLAEHFFCKASTVEDVWDPEGQTSTESDVNENSAGEGAHSSTLDDDKVRELLDGLND